MTRAGLSADERKRRLDLAGAVARDGGSATTFARKAGITPAAAANWLADNAPDLHRHLTDGARGPQVTREKALVRLLLIKSVEDIRGGRARLAKALGISRAALSLFESRWASDGLDAAIADLMGDEPIRKHDVKSDLNGVFPESVQEAAHV